MKLDSGDARTLPGSACSLGGRITWHTVACRSTNTSPGAGATGHTMARSASMALAAQAAAVAALKRQPSPLTPASLALPSHTTHDYTPGSIAGGASISWELPIPETLTSRRAELDGSQRIDTGDKVVVQEAWLHWS